eukprot:Gb_21010 [translate_table: standard]
MNSSTQSMKLSNDSPKNKSNSPSANHHPTETSSNTNHYQIASTLVAEKRRRHGFGYTELKASPLGANTVKMLHRLSLRPFHVRKASESAVYTTGAFPSPFGGCIDGEHAAMPGSHTCHRTAAALKLQRMTSGQEWRTSDSCRIVAFRDTIHRHESSAID